MLSHIQKLYGIELRIKGKTVDEKYQIRQKQSRPIVDKLEAWLIKHQDMMVGKTKLSEVVTYLKKQWSKLITYLANGRWNINNNCAERAINSFVNAEKTGYLAKPPMGQQQVLYFTVLLKPPKPTV